MSETTLIKQQGRIMENKRDHGSNECQAIITREYLHSISRIGDRIKMLNRDVKNMRTEVDKDLSDMEEDLQMLSQAFDSLLADFTNKIKGNQKTWDVEEI